MIRSALVSVGLAVLAKEPAMQITSPQFQPNAEIPALHTCEGKDRAPALAFADVPANAKSLALIVDDPDAPDPAAPKLTWVHWLLYNVPASAKGLPEGGKDLPNGTLLQVIDPEGIRQKDYVDWVRRSGRPVKASYVPKWFLYLAAFGVEILGKVLKRAVPLNRYRISSITPVWPCDCTAAETQLGWKARVLIPEGMKRTFPELSS